MPDAIENERHIVQDHILAAAAAARPQRHSAYRHVVAVGFPLESAGGISREYFSIGIIRLARQNMNIVALPCKLMNQVINNYKRFGPKILRDHEDFHQ
ncbi:hypothetical protein D9M71_807670 [compost metagenome]